MLKASNISKTYDDEKVLNNLSFNVEKGNKVALVGYNGTGKSTLLKILAGLETPDKHGNVAYHKNISVAFIPQDTKQYDSKIVIDFMYKYLEISPDESTDRNIGIMFAGFGLQSADMKKQIGNLSSGQKTKVFLTAMLLKKPDLLLLDEPTNNLDLPALIWLEDYLQKYKSAFIVVSHDIKFLDNVANKIFEIDWATRKLNVSAGKYSDYLINQEKKKTRQKQKHVLQGHELDRLHQLARDKKEKARKGMKWQGTDNDKILRGFKRNRAANSLKDAQIVYNRIDRMDIVENPAERKGFNVDIDSVANDDDKKIVLADLVCGYDDSVGKFDIGPLNLELKFGERIGLLGLNGQGKSTLLKTLTGQIAPLSGEIQIGSGVKVGNLMQEHENLPLDMSPVQFLMDRDYHEPEFLQKKLLDFGFDEIQLGLKIAKLSPGNRARLLMVLFVLEGVNVLILDEPTNHLDLEAGAALESALKKFVGTILVATHDRYFIEKAELKNILVVDGGKMKTIDDFPAYVAEMEKRAKKLFHMLK